MHNLRNHWIIKGKFIGIINFPFERNPSVMKMNDIVTLFVSCSLSSESFLRKPIKCGRYVANVHLFASKFFNAIVTGRRAAWYFVKKLYSSNSNVDICIWIQARYSYSLSMLKMFATWTKKKHILYSIFNSNQIFMHWISNATDFYTKKIMKNKQKNLTASKVFNHRILWGPINFLSVMRVNISVFRRESFWSQILRNFWTL